jgi:hypothetical protein
MNKARRKQVTFIDEESEEEEVDPRDVITKEDLF